MKFVIIKKIEDFKFSPPLIGYLIMAPNGDTQYITENIYKLLKMNNKI